MDVQLQELIDKIKKDGVSTAEEKAAAIIADAEKKAAGIVAEAEKKAAGLVTTAKAETERMEKASVDAIAQAGRNLIISFRDGVTSELSAVINRETATVYNADMVKKVVPEVVKEWVKKDEAESLSVLVPENQLAELENAFSVALKDQLSKGLEIKPDATMSAGFKIGTKDGAAYYDFSAEAVAELFAAYLNPKTAEIMKSAAKGN